MGKNKKWGGGNEWKNNFKNLKKKEGKREEGKGREEKITMKSMATRGFKKQTKIGRRLKEIRDHLSPCP